MPKNPTEVECNPITDRERLKYFTFDLADVAHCSVGAVVIETNSAENAIRAFAAAGNCTCPKCWDSMVVSVGFNRPDGDERITVYLAAQVTALLTGKPAIINQ